MTFTRLDDVWINFLSQVSAIRIWFWWMSKKGGGLKYQENHWPKMFSALPWRCCLIFLCHMCKIMFVFCQHMICWPILAQLQIVHKLLNLGFFCLYLHPQTFPKLPSSFSESHVANVAKDLSPKFFDDLRIFVSHQWLGFNHPDPQGGITGGNELTWNFQRDPGWLPKTNSERIPKMMGLGKGYGLLFEYGYS